MRGSRPLKSLFHFQYFALITSFVTEKFCKTKVMRTENIQEVPRLMFDQSVTFSPPNPAPEELNVAPGSSAGNTGQVLEFLKRLLGSCGENKRLVPGLAPGLVPSVSGTI